MNIKFERSLKWYVRFTEPEYINPTMLVVYSYYSCGDFTYKFWKKRQSIENAEIPANYRERCIVATQAEKKTPRKLDDHIELPSVLTNLKFDSRRYYNPSSRNSGLEHTVSLLVYCARKTGAQVYPNESLIITSSAMLSCKVPLGKMPVTTKGRLFSQLFHNIVLKMLIT